MVPVTLLVWTKRPDSGLCEYFNAYTDAKGFSYILAEFERKRKQLMSRLIGTICILLISIQFKQKKVLWLGTRVSEKQSCLVCLRDIVLTQTVFKKNLPR